MRLFFILLGFLPVTAFAGSAEDLLRGCAAIDAPEERLACYDQAAQQLETPEKTIIRAGEDRNPVPVRPLDLSPAADPSDQEVDDASFVPDSGWLAHAWDLDNKDQNDNFTLRSYRANYILPLSYSFRPNTHPSTPTHPSSNLYDGDVRRLEARFQISLKTRFWNDVFETPLDLWFGYTQKSYWQMYNKEWSSPFRESDYEPEILFTIPVRSNSFPLRMIGGGIVHQSNGQGGDLSRSWNRVYGMLGFERGDWSILARGWYRIPEHSDDNPDITRYMGYGDLVAHYQWGGTSLESQLRLNPKSGKGSAQINFTFPLSGFLRGFVHYFEGYGENLIDYNHYNRSIGIGVYISDWRLK